MPLAKSESAGEAFIRAGPSWAHPFLLFHEPVAAPRRTKQAKGRALFSEFTAYSKCL
jgi:hypothetical protein